MADRIESSESDASSTKTERKPKRILHFSDGVIEEYSSEEEEEEVVEEAMPVNTKELGWVPWMYWAFTVFGSGFIGYCDYAGEKLAWWLGITSPKYYYEIQEAIRMKEEEEARKSKEDAEMAGWRNSNKTSTVHTDLKTAQNTELE